jgi:hypothetical protein
MGAGSGQVATPTQPTNVPQYQGKASSSNPYSQAAGAQAGALAGTQNVMGYTPSQVAATSYQAADPTKFMSAYQNPYESQVIQSALKDMGQAQDISLNQIGAQAEAAKAFGGARHGLAEAQTRVGYGQQAANTIGQLRQQGFNTALGAAQNQAAAINAANQFGAQAGMTAQQLNQSAGLQGAQLGLQAANQLGNLGRQSFGYGQSIQQQQERQGAMQRGVQQQLIDAAQKNLAQYTGAPTQGLNTLVGSLTGAGVPSGQTTSSSPGLFNYLQVLAGMQG